MIYDDRRTVLKGIRNECLTSGQRTISSGVISDYFIDIENISKNRDWWHTIAYLFESYIVPNTINPAYILGPPNGGNYIAEIVSKDFFEALFFVKLDKDNYVVDLPISYPVVIVEDVVTTGNSIVNLLGKINQQRNKVIDCVCLVNRNPEESTKYVFEKTGVKLQSIFTVDEVLNIDN